jgi:hypothetical protein
VFAAQRPEDRNSSLFDAINASVPQYADKISELFCSSLGYTLLGKKPVSFEEVNIDPQALQFLQEYFSRSTRFIFKVVPAYREKVEICLLNRKGFF